MSRIGKHPITVPSGVDVAIAGHVVKVKGGMGELERTVPAEVEVTREDDKIWVKPRDDQRRSRSMWGMSRTLVSNMVEGVSKGFTQNLEIQGVGYRAAVAGDMLTLQLGYSHEIKVAIPPDIKVACAKPTEISLSGPDRQRVGQLAAEIRGLRKPEPYKGKGIRYAGERVLRKEGKKK